MSLPLTIPKILEKAVLKDHLLRNFYQNFIDTNLCLGATKFHKILCINYGVKSVANFHTTQTYRHFSKEAESHSGPKNCKTSIIGSLKVLRYRRYYTEEKKIKTV